MMFVMPAVVEISPVLEGQGIRVEFDSARRGFDCLTIESKVDGRYARFFWKGLPLKDETNAVDVVATVALSADGVSAQWRISVENRSKRWGLASVDYSVIRHVAEFNTVSALLPRDNLGGEGLVEGARRHINGRLWDIKDPCFSNAVCRVTAR